MRKCPHLRQEKMFINTGVRAMLYLLVTCRLLGDQCLYTHGGVFGRLNFRFSSVFYLVL